LKYKLVYSKRFKQDVRKLNRKKIDELKQILKRLSEGEILPEKFRCHKLVGKFKGNMECHISPDQLLIYSIDDDIMILKCIRTGSHSDLFK
jgi:mRNA interferase YafQ